MEQSQQPGTPGGIATLPAPADEPPLTPNQSAALDTRQDTLMTDNSADGRPPARRVRRFGWTFLAIAAASIILAAVAWAITHKISTGAAVGFSVLVVSMIVLGAAPVLGAGLLRGREGRTANKQARAQLNLSPTAPAPVPGPPQPPR